MKQDSDGDPQSSDRTPGLSPAAQAEKPALPAPPVPRVSILVPARNEQENIAACVASLLAQDEEIEIIVADDSSEDSTAAIVERLAATHAQVRGVKVPPLPPGWLGKNHALDAAVKLARGEWLLFTDADTRHAPGQLARVLGRAQRKRLDLISYSPEQEMQTWWEKAVIPLIFAQLATLFPFARVNDPEDAQAAASGTYLLIPRAVYEAVGGHAAIRGEMLEDVALARRIKQAGYRIWFGAGDGVVRVRMYRRFGEMWEGWTKNLFLLFGSDRRAVRAAAWKLALSSWLPLLLGAPLLAAGAVRESAGLSFLGVMALSWAVNHAVGHARATRRAAMAIYFLPGAMLVFLLLLNSERRYSRKLGVRWKGREYKGGEHV